MPGGLPLLCPGVQQGHHLIGSALVVHLVSRGAGVVKGEGSLCPQQVAAGGRLIRKQQLGPCTGAEGQEYVAAPCDENGPGRCRKCQLGAVLVSKGPCPHITGGVNLAVALAGESLAVFGEGILQLLVTVVEVLH